MRAQQVAIIASLLLGLVATALAATQQADYFILLEDGTRKTYGDLRAMAGGGNCCFPANFPFAVTYSSSKTIRFFIGEKCDPATEVNSSTYPVSVKSIDLCAKGCDPNKGCGLNGMNTKGVSTTGGKWPLNQGQECADKANGRVLSDKTCKAVGKDNKFAYRLLCKQDCTGAYTCQEPSFDRSKCAGAKPVVTFVGLGQKCGYVQDNKQYECGGNHTSCKNGVCVSTLPSGK